MKDGLRFCVLSLVFIPWFSWVVASGTESKSNPKRALLIIDIQEFYFPGGSSELVKPDEASLNARKLLEHFRKTDQLVIHVKHKASTGSNIHEHVLPIAGERVIEKTQINSFKNSPLHQFLQENKIEALVICGMQTHMCVEAATRAACDLGYVCTLIQDACATKDLEYQGEIVAADDVHLSTLATLNLYLQIAQKGRITDTKEYLSGE